MKEAADWVEHYRVYWEGQLDALAQFFDADQQPTEREKQ